MPDSQSKSFRSIDKVFDHIIKLYNVSSNKILTLYAYNASGKTRLSTLFYENLKEKVLCYNAFTEDLFSWDNNNWDNNNYALQIKQDPLTPNAEIFEKIQDEKLKDKIIANFKNFTGSELKPDFDDFSKKQITFTDPSSENNENIKISRGEESVFIWSVFYTVLDAVIRSTTDSDNTGSDNTDSDNYEYVVIDDPVSSMDDKCIITIALKLVELISNSNNQLKFLITTHHALFFNVLFNTHEKNWNNKSYILSKQAEAEEYNLEKQEKDSPFAYHHVIISEINEAIDKDNLKKYHFNLFRALLEKTDNFLRYSGDRVWKKRLEKDKHGKAFIKILNHYSHDSLSDLESKFLPERNKKIFKKAFDSFLKEFKFFKKSNQLEPRYLHENDKEHFKKAFDSFLKEFKFFKKSNQLGPEDLPEDDKEHFKDAFNSFLEEFNFPEEYKVNND